MDIQQLKYFLKVAELGSFTHAGQELSVSQPALSRSIAKIEEELGLPVFERQTRQVVLTEAGKSLRWRAMQIVQMLDEIPKEICDDESTGLVRIGVIPTIAPYWLPAFVSNVRSQVPDATVHVREDITERLIQACNQGELDLVVASAPLELGYLESKVLHEEEIKIAIPASHSLAKSKSISPQDLDNEPLVMLGEGHCLSDQIDAYCRRRSIQPVMFDRTTQLTTILELVSYGYGVSFVPSMACIADKRRVFRSMARPSPHRKITVVWNPYRFESKLQQRIRKLMETYPWS
jgi:LysR family transcriptional regulator, hydrogen peroxide-inducible genes activator